VNALFAFFEGALSPSHLLVVVVVGLILFGRQLPEMGRALGKGLLEFRKGLQGIEDELAGGPSPTPDRELPPRRIAATPARFDCPADLGAPSAPDSHRQAG
jgi:sec-independent protein translocase protein TatA